MSDDFLNTQAEDTCILHPVSERKKRLSTFLLLITGLLLSMACETSAPTLDPPDPPQPAMTYSVPEVSKVRTQHNVDQRAMSIAGVLSVGIAGASNDDAWIQIQCKDTEAISRARTELGDSLAGVPIKFTLSDTIRAQ